MNWNDISGIIVTVIASAGGTAALITGMLKIVGEQILERVSLKYEQKLEREMTNYKQQLNKEMESYKKKLESKSYVSKTRFDAEFNIYRELSKSAASMVKTISQLFSPFFRNDIKTQEKNQKLYEDAIDTVIIFQDSLASYAPFITTEIYLLFKDLEKLCKIQLENFIAFQLSHDAEKHRNESVKEYHDAFNHTNEICECLDNIILKLRTYLALLDVQE